MFEHWEIDRKIWETWWSLNIIYVELLNVDHFEVNQYIESVSMRIHWTRTFGQKVKFLISIFQSLFWSAGRRDGKPPPTWFLTIWPRGAILIETTSQVLTSRWLFLQMKMEKIYQKSRDSIWLFNFEIQFGDSIWRLCFRFIAAIECSLHSQITVGNVTLPKAVLSTA